MSNSNYHLPKTVGGPSYPPKFVSPTTVTPSGASKSGPLGRPAPAPAPVPDPAVSGQ